MHELLKNIQSGMKKHAPEILTGFGIAGMISATIMAVRATPKAMQLLEKRKKEVDEEKLSPIDTVKTAGACYIPSAIVSCVSVACLVGASSANMRRNAALATAYAIAESNLKEYQEKVIETVGKKKEQSVRDAVAKEKIAKDPVGGREVYVTSYGDTLCYDVISGRYFKSDIETIRRAANEVNRRMIHDMYISLNEFYDEIGLDHTRMGDDLGWNVNDDLLELTFSSQLASDGTPCLVLDYCVAPRYDYQR